MAACDKAQEIGPLSIVFHHLDQNFAITPKLPGSITYHHGLIDTGSDPGTKISDLNWLTELSELSNEAFI